MSKPCSMCGECCRILPILAGNLRKESIEYLLARGLIWDRVQGFVLVPQVCVHLTDQNLCDIHDHKPELCKKFHGQKRSSGGGLYWVPPGCTMK